MDRGQQSQRAVRRQAVDAALAAEGLQAEWEPGKDARELWLCQEAQFQWRYRGWRIKWTRQMAQQGSPELHRALLALGLECEGYCGWGKCGQEWGHEGKQSDGE